MRVRANGIDVEVEDSGGRGEAVLLIMGLGMQLTAWSPALVQGLVDAGYRVIRHDNRDAGLSQHMDHLSTPNLVLAFLRMQLGLKLRPPYTVEDMALDALGVLDALSVERAHVVGASMGGMIAQRVALLAPERTLSLTSIMSSSGARGLPGPAPDVMRQLATRPPRDNFAAAQEHFMHLFQAIGSPAFPLSVQQMSEQVGQALQRAYNPRGTQRQMLAVAADTRRADELVSIACPTLVVHGRADPLVPLAGGMDTARRISGARLEIIDGMGHDMPPGVVEKLLPMLLEHLGGVHAGEAAA